LKRLKRFLALAFVLLILAAGGGGYWLTGQWKPVNPSDKLRLVRFEDSTPLTKALERLEAGKVLKSAYAAKIYAKWKNVPATVRIGTYQLGGQLTTGQVMDALQKPMTRMVRIPESMWARRTAPLMDKDQLGSSSDYMALVAHPSEFAKDVSFPLPADSLEGYLYPDTYDLPPLMSTKSVIRRQLKNFESRIWKGLGKPKNLHRAIIIASMVEMEVKRDDERAMVAGVIENRLAKDMPLQIDAAINYGIQKWRTLTYDDYRNVDSPYNTYRNKGLPPGPICSPTVKSIKAALNPAKHKYLYYVALPSGRSLFAETHDQHIRNVAKRRAAIARGTPE
jgi:UPF0755 protein